MPCQHAVFSLCSQPWTFLAVITHSSRALHNYPQSMCISIRGKWLRTEKTEGTSVYLHIPSHKTACCFEKVSRTPRKAWRSRRILNTMFASVIHAHCTCSLCSLVAVSKQPSHPAQRILHHFGVVFSSNWHFCTRVKLLIVFKDEMLNWIIGIQQIYILHFFPFDHQTTPRIVLANHPELYTYLKNLRRPHTMMKLRTPTSTREVNASYIPPEIIGHVVYNYSISSECYLRQARCFRSSGVVVITTQKQPITAADGESCISNCWACRAHWHAISLAIVRRHFLAEADASRLILITSPSLCVFMCGSARTGRYRVRLLMQKVVVLISIINLEDPNGEYFIGDASSSLPLWFLFFCSYTTTKPSVIGMSF